MADMMVIRGNCRQRNGERCFIMEKGRAIHAIQLMEARLPDQAGKEFSEKQLNFRTARQARSMKTIFAIRFLSRRQKLCRDFPQLCLLTKANLKMMKLPPSPHTLNH